MSKIRRETFSFYKKAYRCRNKKSLKLNFTGITCPIKDSEGNIESTSSHSQPFKGYIYYQIYFGPPINQPHSFTTQLAKASTTSPHKPQQHRKK